jgi:type VI secretion system protein ImpJ
MYLAPHHFEVQGRDFEDSIRFTTGNLWYEPYGVLGCALDAEALRNGTLSLVHARGIFQDGLPFNMPESDPLPEPRAIADAFPPTADSITALLAIPARRQNGVNCVDPEFNGGQSARYVAETRLLYDETTGRDEKPVRIGRKNINLLLDTESAEDSLTLPVARVTRDGSGHFIFDPRFIPPCLRINANDRLMIVLRRLIEILDEKSQALSRTKQTGAKSWAEYSTRDIASFWMLHTVNSALAPLRHLFFTKRGHPEELYLELSKLAGALCTFGLESHPRTLPLYDHLRLDRVFDALDEHIRMHLETIVPTKCIPIALTKVAEYLYEGEVSDQRLLGQTRWVFAIQSPIGEADVITSSPRLVKICSAQYIRELVKRALPGLALTHLPVPPSSISARVDTQYFGMSKAGPCWDSVVKTRRVGLYIPGELPDPKPELLVVLES